MTVALALLSSTIGALAAGCSSKSSGQGGALVLDGGASDAGPPVDAAPSPTDADADATAADDDSGSACALSPVGATCTAAHDCCQSGPGLPFGQACFTTPASTTTRTCQARCNATSDCPTGSCCLPDESSFPAFGSAPTEPGGFCFAESSSTSASCITGDANGYVCTGNDNTGFVCTAATTDAGPSSATCTTGVTTYCACQALAGPPCASTAESEYYASCIDGEASPYACYAGYQADAGAGTSGCAAASAACGQ